jgi:uncharacterized zinc-type alcohol dehydrogenase-like protein
MKVKAIAAVRADAPLQPFEIERRAVEPADLRIEIQYCGVCHSDIHSARNEWGGSIYPMVPGHEIIGRVVERGAQARRFDVGTVVGVGCFVNSCRTCEACRDNEEQYCENEATFTYNSSDRDGKPTYGGYSAQIVVDEAYVYRIPSSLALPGAAPLLCAGITTYSPLRRFGVRAGQRVGIIGLGGLGHMGVKLAASMGAKVTVFSTSPHKESDARRLGAADFAVSRDAERMKSLAGQFDFLLDTVSAQHDPNLYLGCLKRNGAMALVGAPEKPLEVQAFSLISGKRRLAGSLIGGRKETQEVLDYCAEKKIEADVEVIPASQINDAFDRTVRGDVKYRFVLEMKSL